MPGDVIRVDRHEALAVELVGVGHLPTIASLTRYLRKRPYIERRIWAARVAARAAVTKLKDKRR